MRCDDDVLRIPQQRVFREWLSLCDVESRTSDHPALQRIHQRVIVDRDSTPDIDDVSIRPEQSQSLRPDDSPSLLIGRKDLNEDVGLGQRRVNVINRDDLVTAPAPSLMSNPTHLRTQGRQMWSQGLSDGSESPDEHIGVKQGRHRAVRMKGPGTSQLRSPSVLLLSGSRLGKLPYQGQYEGQCVLGNHARVQPDASTQHDIRVKTSTQQGVRTSSQPLHKS